jgi:hypothetical protein
MKIFKISPNSKRYKLFAIIVISLLFFGSILPLVHGLNEGVLFNNDPEIFYVGGSGPGNYSSIQNAIDDASDGDTIFVYDDSSPYYENIVIDKSITLTGEDNNTTIISGQNPEDTTIYIINESEGVTIKFFNITSCSSIPGAVGITIGINCNNNFILNNIVTRNVCGIVVGSNENNIYKNVISNNDRAVLVYSRNNVFSHNIIENNLEGFFIAGINNNISNNNICQNEYGFKSLGEYNNIFSNIISNNRFGIWTTYPSYATQLYNDIEKNNFVDNEFNLYRYKNYGWNANYWDDWIGLKFPFFPFDIFPYHIPGTPNYQYGKPPVFYFNLDWYPAKEPYDILV